MSAFIERVKRGRFIQWVVGYLAGAWILLQVLGFLFQTFHWPEFILQGITVFLAISFIAAIILAWFHGEPGTQRPSAAEIALVSSTLVIAVAASVFVAKRAALAADGVTQTAQSGIPMDTTRSVAVLPFVNTSGDPKEEYFSDGMTDELAHALSKIPTLRVASRTSSYAFKGKPLTSPQIGKALQVAYIIAGSVRRAGDHVRVTTELSSTRDGVVTWTHEFESSQRDVFAVQDSFTREIVSELTPRFRGRTASLLAQNSRGTDDEAAYDDFMQGKFYWSQRGAGNLKRAVDYFRSAIKRDSTFARAHAALAMTYGTLPGYVVDSMDIYPAMAAASAARALALDSSIIEAYLGAGTAKQSALDYNGAEVSFRNAIRIDSTSATAHQWLGEVRLGLGRPDDAIFDARRAVQLDSLAPIMHYDLSLSLLYGRRFPEALAQARKAIELEPGSWFWKYLLGFEYVFAGSPDSAIVVLDSVRLRAPEVPGTRAMLVLAYAAANRWSDASRMRTMLHNSGGISSDVEAKYADMVMGDANPLIRALQTRIGRALFSNSVFGYIPCSPIIDPLRNDARYADILGDMHTHDCNKTSPWPVKTQPPANLRAVPK